MRYPKTIAIFVCFITLLLGNSSHAASSEEHAEFAARMKILLRNNANHEFAFIAIQEYLEVEPNAAPVKRELAHYHMKTSAVRTDSIIGFEYPKDAAKKIIGLLDEAVDANPDDHEALSLLVYTHALQGNTELGKAALEKASALEPKADWLTYNTALLAISDNRPGDAKALLLTLSENKKSMLKNSEARRIHTSTWITLKRLGLASPEHDPMPAVADGLATRVDVSEFARYLLDYDSNDKPLIVLVSSQDNFCGPCITEIDNFYKFAQSNKENGSLYNVVYTSLEPWQDMQRYQDDFGSSLYINGVPAYNVKHNDIHIATWQGAANAMVERMITDPEWILSNGNTATTIAGHTDYVLDYMLSTFETFKNDTKKKKYKAMAFAVSADGEYWTHTKESGFASQELADEAALTRCEAIKQADNTGTCEMYARGDNIVATNALKRKEVRTTALNNINKRKKKEQAIAAKQEAADQKAQELASNKVANNSPTAAIKQYASLDKHFKALAIAESNGKFIHGFAENEITQYRANEIAIESCNTAKKETTITGECLLHTIGNTEIKDVSAASIKKTTAKQQKRNAKKSVLGASYNKFRKLSGDKAYAISIDENKQWAYGFAFGKRGEDKAQAEAIEACNADRTKKNLSAQCRVLIVNSTFVDQQQ